MFQPTTFGKYFLTRRIAVGGMAEVFAAKLYGADGFEKDLVIKQILPQYARDPEFVQSFVTEAKIAVSLNHANVVGIYELGRVDGTYFIAMELVDGLDAFALVQEANSANRRIDIGAALLITEEVAKGLDYAHRKVGPDGLPLGLVHRDLNPRNVLVSREGEVKILDFGIAKTASRVTAMPKTRAGVVKGTTGYMSPEQATGHVVDARTDVYQAGLLLWELLAHQPLFWRPDDEETRERMRRHHVAPPSTIAADIPRELDQIVLSALARKPEERLQSAAELVRQISQLRYARYPQTTPVDLGRVVTTLADRRELDHREAYEQLPSTVELDSAIADAVSSSGRHRIETIARAPSDVVRAPVATSASTQPAAPIDDLRGMPRADEPLQLPTADVTVPTSAGADEPLVDVGSTGRADGSSGRGWWIAAAALLLVAGGLGIWRQSDGPTGTFEVTVLDAGASAAPSDVGGIASAPRTDGGGAAENGAVGNANAGSGAAANGAAANGAAANGTAANGTAGNGAPNGSAAEGNGASRNGASGSEVAANSTAGAGASDAGVGRSRAVPSPTKRGPPAAGAGVAVVAFGTRSCSSRVSVDGTVIARATPTFDHRIASGEHTIVIEGTSCPPIERPGSLRRGTPTLTKRVRMEAGARLKVIADYERERIIVRRQ